jgi:hypothetical protein
MAKVNSGGSGKAIYGQVPELGGQASKALSQALDDLGDSFSTVISGPVDDKRRVEYEPEDGK